MPRELNAGYVAMVRAGLDMLNARFLLLLALCMVAAIWGYTVYKPEWMRLAAAAAFTLGVFCPLTYLYARKGVN